MATQYNFYREMIKTRQGIEWNNALVAGVGESLGAIHHEIEIVRRTTSLSLEIQQELLKKDYIQAQLDESIYQAERTIEKFDDMNEQVGPSTQYFELGRLLDAIDRDNISTSMIRGRDNKAAFDKIINRAIERRQKLRLFRRICGRNF